MSYFDYTNIATSTVEEKQNFASAVVRAYDVLLATNVIETKNYNDVDRKLTVEMKGVRQEMDFFCKKCFKSGTVRVKVPRDPSGHYKPDVVIEMAEELVDNFGKISWSYALELVKKAQSLG